jgi:carbonic anhydrase
MNKDGYVKIGAVVFAFLIFSRTGSAATDARLASADAKAANEKITALQAQLGTSGDVSAATSGATGATHATTTTDGTHGVAAAKKSPTTTVKANAASLHWGYEGETGPAAWGSLDPTYAACADGTRQSPIDLSGAKPTDLPDLSFQYDPAVGSIVDNGHTIQIDVKPGDSVTTDTGTYALVQFHFHGPSEHTVAGKAYPLEIHFVHKDTAGKHAVVGVLVAEGAPNPAFDPIVSGLPGAPNKAKTLAEPIALASFLPAIQATYRYAGSLTTPPCTEGVSWNVMAQPITMSKAQITALTGAFAEPNNRPTQKLGGRSLTVDSTVAMGH